MGRYSRRSSKPTGHDHKDRWLITYADLITLLLIFFIVMYSVSQIDSDKYKVLTESLQLTFQNPHSNSILNGGKGVTGTAGQSTSEGGQSGQQGQTGQQNGQGQEALTNREQAFREQERELTNLMKVIQNYVQTNNLQGQVTVVDKPQGISITLSDQFLFDEGKAELKPGSLGTLARLASLFQSINTTISIEGHTDNLPIVHASRYQDNWELSGARALSVLRYFIDVKKINQAKFQYAGYGATRPTADNSTPAGRQKNRRVEIIVLRQLQE
ncbi:flagellar motor protein MotB [Paenibacillus campi]|uniref:flagellar motor protein MotB n=1 Tax=Paenibacillus campi TaxID=3106031 RepID=UPI002AFFA750|nr:flagellar motor protein MotB [Paenibacillus sp. SGZ-1014]